MPVLMLWSLEDGTLWTDSCPRLRATMATALNLLRVPALGLLAFCRFIRSSVLRLIERWSVHTNDTCILTQATQCDHNKPKFFSLSQTHTHTLPQNQAEEKAQEDVFFWILVLSEKKGDGWSANLTRILSLHVNLSPSLLGSSWPLGTKLHDITRAANTRS